LEEFEHDGPRDHIGEPVAFSMVVTTTVGIRSTQALRGCAPFFSCQPLDEIRGELQPATIVNPLRFLR
jgi:hypothetical protein